MTNDNLPPLPIRADVWSRVMARLALPEQQASIVELLVRGLRDKRIARELGIKLPTLRTYFSRIFLRIGVEDRVDLIIRVFVIAMEENGLGPSRHD